MASSTTTPPAPSITGISAYLRVRPLKPKPATQAEDDYNANVISNNNSSSTTLLSPTSRTTRSYHTLTQRVTFRRNSVTIVDDVSGLHITTVDADIHDKEE